MCIETLVTTKRNMIDPEKIISLNVSKIKFFTQPKLLPVIMRALSCNIYFARCVYYILFTFAKPCCFFILF